MLSYTLRKTMVKQNENSHSQVLPFSLGVFLGLLIFLIGLILSFEKEYQGKIYPGVKILDFDASAKRPWQIEQFLKHKNLPFEKLKISFVFEDKIATLSGEKINLGFDSQFSSRQAYQIGREGNFFSQLWTQFQVLTAGIELAPLFKWDKTPIEETLKDLAQKIDFPAQNALFRFEKGKVTAFKTAQQGRRINTPKTLTDLEKKLAVLTKQASFPSEINIPLEIEIVEPEISTSQANNLGIEEFLGRGVSYFKGSPLERIHNLGLASSKLDGLLITPGQIFSLSKVLGEISLATGYQTSYIIKEGKTVLGDGGGVCQVSTTFFRAALNTGLAILERHPHSYRVAYYEQGGFSPGMDAAIFVPDVDLKIKNNTPAHVLIQTNFNSQNSSLSFEFYGKRDGRKIEISPVKVWEQKPPPEDKYIDDPNLPAGQIKQIDWKAWGAKTNFSYRVTKNGEILEEKSFYSNFLPWQAIFLRGAGE